MRAGRHGLRHCREYRARLYPKQRRRQERHQRGGKVECGPRNADFTFRFDNNVLILTAALFGSRLLHAAFGTMMVAGRVNEAGAHPLAHAVMHVHRPTRVCEQDGEGEE